MSRPHKGSTRGVKVVGYGDNTVIGENERGYRVEFEFHPGKQTCPDYGKWVTIEYDGKGNWNLV